MNGDSAPAPLPTVEAAKTVPAGPVFPGLAAAAARRTAGSTLHVHTAGHAVPPLDEETQGLLDDLAGIHPGIDLIRAGARLLMLDRLTRDETQTILATFGNPADGTDLPALLTAAVRRLTDYDSNPCLRDLSDDDAKDVRRIGEAVAVDVETSWPRDLVAETCARIDPYPLPDPTLSAPHTGNSTSVRRDGDDHPGHGRQP